jgi:hypothetical protein
VTAAAPLARVVIPAQAGIQWRPRLLKPYSYWIPACAGMTSESAAATD